MVAYIICEHAHLAKAKILQEADTRPGSAKHAVVETVLQDADEFNRNTRNYPLNILLGGLNAEHIMELLRHKSWCGEYGHPNITGNSRLDAIRQVKIDPQFVSHRINRWWNVNTRIFGEVQGFGPFGAYFDDAVREELETAFSLRAVGGVNVTPKGNVVKGRLHVTTYDNVFVPSHRNAYQTKVIDSMIQEHSRLMTEAFAPLQEDSLQQMTDFLKSESKNIQMISEIMELCHSTISLSEDMKSAIISDSEKHAKVVVPIEEYLHQEAVNALKRI